MVAATTDDVEIVENSLKSLHDTFRLRAALFRDADGGFTVIAQNLPGVISEGHDLVDAVENVRDAFRQSIISYRESGQDVPWDEVLFDDAPDFVFHLTVNVDG
jgi:predicted RNase H-like HicB family nuclease